MRGERGRGGARTRNHRRHRRNLGRDRWNGDGWHWKEQAIRPGTDAKAVPVLARFLAQWLAVELDAKLSDPNLEFEKSPLYAELLAITKEALTTNKTVKSFVNGTDVAAPRRCPRPRGARAMLRRGPRTSRCRSRRFRS